MLALIFFSIALLYSTIGFGGGSSYLAVLAVSDVPYETIPKIGLICNLLVVSGGCWHYYRKGLLNFRLILPFVVSSVPLAFIGGMYPVKREIFLGLITFVLLASGIRLLFLPNTLDKEKAPPLPLSLFVGSLLGLLAGITALGGGIFLSPLMMNMKWGKPKEAAAAASAFIFLNSSAGLAGQLTKGLPDDLTNDWPLFLAVILGGQMGSRLGTSPYIPQKIVQRGTAVLILIISSRLLFKLSNT